MTRGHHAAGAGEHPDQAGATDLHLEGEVAPEAGDAPENRFERGRVAQAELFGRSGGGTSRPLVAIVAVAALVVGAVAGAYFWGGRVESTNTEAARARVSLGAMLAPAVNPTTPNQFVIDYTNFGPYPLTIGTVKLDDFALVATPAATGIEIAPGKTAEQKISVKVDCTAVTNPDSWEPATTATVAVTTADGVDRTTKVTLSAGDPGISPLGNLGQPACGWKSLSFGDLYGYVEAAETSGDTVVSHVVMRNPYDSSDAAAPPPGAVFSILLDTLSVRSGDGTSNAAYTVSTAFPLPAELPPDGRFDIVWKIADCTQAQQATADDMSLNLDGTVNGKSPGTVRMLGPNNVLLIAPLVRLAYTSCGSPGG